MLDGKTDDQLLAEIREDSQQAFKALFDRYYQKMCYVGYRTYADRHKAKDFAQEIFCDLWNKRKTLTITSSLNGYLSRAMRNKAIDYIRSQRLNFDEGAAVRHLQTFTDPTSFSELDDVVKATVNNLPERCRMVFNLSRAEGLSHKEIAHLLNISTKTIENQITKALKSLRKSIAEYNGDVKNILLILGMIVGGTL